MECKLYTQNHSIINGHGVWHYLIETPIGNIHIVEYERDDMTLKRFIFDGDNESAEKKYRSVMKKMVVEFT